jgi:hypothetical protein
MKDIVKSLTGMILIDVNTFTPPFPNLSHNLTIGLNILIAIITLVKILKAKKKKKDDKYFNK